MPQKTIYVSDADLELYQRAQEITGGNLSAAITQGLRRLVDAVDAVDSGMEEVTVRVGTGLARRQRFFGVELASWSRSTKDGVEAFRAWQTRTGKIAVHCTRSAEHLWSAGEDGKATGLRKHLSQHQQWGVVPERGTLTVYDDLEQLRGEIPDELYQLVAAGYGSTQVEELDI